MSTAPFHKSICATMRSAGTQEALSTLGELIKSTMIPENHEDIMSIFKMCADNLGLSERRPNFVNDVLASIEDQAKEYA